LNHFSLDAVDGLDVDGLDAVEGLDEPDGELGKDKETFGEEVEADIVGDDKDAGFPIGVPPREPVELVLATMLMRDDALRTGVDFTMGGRNVRTVPDLTLVCVRPRRSKKYVKAPTCSSNCVVPASSRARIS